jgi:hypothetical protein
MKTLDLKCIYILLNVKRGELTGASGRGKSKDEVVGG